MSKSLAPRVLRRPLRESEVQRAVVALYRKANCDVGVFSEGRRTRIPAGWPDLAVLLPCREHLLRRPDLRTLVFYHETKSATGKLSEAQDIMHDKLRLRRERVIVGGEAEARAWLVELGLLAR